MRAESGTDYLAHEVAERLAGRLSDIRRAFPVVLDIGGVMAESLRGREGTRHVFVAGAGAEEGVSLVCDAEFLPFGNGKLDAVVSCLDLQWINDLPGVLAQVRMALKPDGLFLAALAGGETLYELRECLMEAEIGVTGGASPRVSPFIGLQDMAGLLQRAGFALPVADTEKIVVEYGDMFGLMRDLRGMGAANATFNRLKRFTRREVFFEAARIYRDRYGDASGRIPATFEIIHCIGWNPAEGQQKPLKPGSAQVRLADALEVREGDAGEKALP